MPDTKMTADQVSKFSPTGTAMGKLQYTVGQVFYNVKMNIEKNWVKIKNKNLYRLILSDISA